MAAVVTGAQSIAAELANPCLERVKSDGRH